MISPLLTLMSGHNSEICYHTNSNGRVACGWGGGCHCSLPYCPEQAPMGACSSRKKHYGWALTRRSPLNYSVTSLAGLTIKVGEV